MPSHVQAVYFMKPKWSIRRSAEWLSAHGLEPIKPAHIRGSEIRYRILEPTFHRYTTLVLVGGVHLVIGWES